LIVGCFDGIAETRSRDAKQRREASRLYAMNGNGSLINPFNPLIRCTICWSSQAHSNLHLWYFIFWGLWCWSWSSQAHSNLHLWYFIFWGLWCWSSQAHSNLHLWYFIFLGLWCWSSQAHSNLHLWYFILNFALHAK